MKLVEKERNVTQTTVNGEVKERINNINYNVVDDEGNNVGDCTIASSYINLNVHNASLDIAAMAEKMEELL